MNLYQMDDYSYYSGETADDAAKQYTEDSGEAPDDDYPRQCTDAELDREIPDREEGGAPTGTMTTMRAWLNDSGPAATFVCGIES